MPSRHTRKSHVLATQAAGLAFAIPQVLAHRIARMTLAGLSPSLRDQNEFYLMGAEKVAAFYESWNAMLLEMFRANLAFSVSAAAFFWNPLRPGSHAALAVYGHMHRTSLAVLGKGIAPIHRRAIANAKRLGRVR